MLNIFEEHGRINKNNYKFQFWQLENHPVLLDNFSDSYKQRLNYLHENPVRAGFVQPSQRKYILFDNFNPDFIP